MEDLKMFSYINDLFDNIPKDWLDLTTHRLDIYNEALAKSEFIEQFDILYQNNNSDTVALNELPTAYDYIRLGHPLSSVLEWAIAKLNHIAPENVISFSSRSMPLFAVLRKNLINAKDTLINYTGELPDFFNEELLQQVYGYQFKLNQIESIADIPDHDGSSIILTQQGHIGRQDLHSKIDFYIHVLPQLGSIMMVNGKKNKDYISSIQHVRRRESIAMTPPDCIMALKLLSENTFLKDKQNTSHRNETKVLELINEITHTNTKALIGSSGLSI